MYNPSEHEQRFQRGTIYINHWNRSSNMEDLGPSDFYLYRRPHPTRENIHQVIRWYRAMSNKSFEYQELDYKHYSWDVTTDELDRQLAFTRDGKQLLTERQWVCKNMLLSIEPHQIKLIRRSGNTYFVLTNAYYTPTKRINCSAYTFRQTFSNTRHTYGKAEYFIVATYETGSTCRLSSLPVKYRPAPPTPKWRKWLPLTPVVDVSVIGENWKKAIKPLITIANKNISEQRKLAVIQHLDSHLIQVSVWNPTANDWHSVTISCKVNYRSFEPFLMPITEMYGVDKISSKQKRFANQSPQNGLGYQYSITGAIQMPPNPRGVEDLTAEELAVYEQTCSIKMPNTNRRPSKIKTEGGFMFNMFERIDFEGANGKLCFRSGGTTVNIPYYPIPDNFVLPLEPGEVRQLDFVSALGL